jgi:PAS domain S-box-containing protein
MDEHSVRQLRARLASLGDPLTVVATLFAYSPSALQIYAADGHCLLVNDAFRQLFGTEPPPEYNVLHDEIAARQGVLTLIRRAFAGETVTVPTVWYDPRELRQVHITEGRRIAMQSTFVPLKDDAGHVSHVAITFKDVTAETTRQELLEAIVQQSGDGIVVADPDGVLRMFNAAAAAQHGVEARDVPAAEWTRVFGLRTLDGRALPLDETPLHRALAGQRLSNARWIVHRPDGSERILSGTATPIRHADGSPAGAVLTTRDETERVQMEESLRRSADERERIMGVLGHDLRSPLSAIAMASGMLTRGGLSPRQGELVTQVMRAVERMRRMIADLLDFTRARAGAGLPLSLGPVRLDALLEEIVAELAVAHPERTITLETRAPAESREAELDADRIAQATVNLVGNALEHGARNAPVGVLLDGDGERVRIAVHNLGPPLPPELRARLFQPFARGEGAAAGGVGLGLFIVHQIAEAHGGSVDVVSDTGGTTFTLDLPRRRP